MSSLSNLKLGTEVEVDDRDTLGGNYTLESGIYLMKIDEAYMSKSSGGAASLNLTFKHGQQILRQTIYVTSGDKKGNKPTYTDKNTGKERPLPGMSLANSLVYLTVGLELGDLSTEEKMINIYDREVKKDIPTKADVLMELLGKDVVLGIVKSIENKNAKNDAGVYVPTGQTRVANEIDKFFQVDTMLTVTEMKAGLTSGEFMSKWSDKHTGVTKDNSTPSTAGSAAGVPGAAAASATPSLF